MWERIKVETKPEICFFEGEYMRSKMLKVENNKPNSQKRKSFSQSFDFPISVQRQLWNTYDD